jgi:hypothetical protein
LALLCVIAAVFALLDPRVVGTSGIYNRELTFQINHLSTDLIWKQIQTVQRDLNVAFFGQSMSPSMLFTLVLLVGSGIVTARLPHWGLPVLMLLCVTTVVSSDPRYYLMILPTLWLGWVLLSAQITRRTPATIQGYVMAGLLLVPVVLNFGRVAGLIYDQRLPDLAVFRGGDRERAFYERYNEGQVLQYQALAELIRTHTRPDDVIVSPAANVITFFSGRRVFGDRAILLNEPNERKHAQLVHEFGADYWVFPAALYRSRDNNLFNLMRRKAIVPSQLIAWAGPMYLARATIVVEGAATQPTTSPTAVPKKKRKKPTTTSVVDPGPGTTQAALATTKSVKKKATATKATTKKSTTKKATTKKATAIQEPATTQPAATPSKKKKKKKPTTAPTTTIVTHE